MIYRKSYTIKTLIILTTFLLGTALSDNLQKKSDVDPQGYPLPFAFSISGGSNSILNPWKDKVVNFHLSLFSGQVKGVQGLQLGLISNRVTSDFVGYDATGIYSRVDGNFSGFQAGALISRVDGHFVGMQSGGIINNVGSDFFGLQAAGILNRVRGSFTGIQVSGILNESQNVRYVQIAGISNQAADVEGVQISGIVNEAKHVKGVQIGLVNRSEKLDGIAIGLVNLSESGSVHIVSWASSNEDYQVGVKFAPNDYWYTTLTVGQQTNELGQKQLTSFESHLGFHIPLVAKFYTEIDLGTGNTIPSKFMDWESNDSQQILEARLGLGIRITPRLSIVGGISNKRVYSDQDFWSQSNDALKPFIGIQL